MSHPPEASSSSHPLSNPRQPHLTSIPPGLSKNAAKKLAKKAYFDSTKSERRQAERLKKKEKRKIAYSQTKKQKVERKPVGAKLLIDCGFDDLMTEKEVASMGQQLMYCYASNRGSRRPFEQIGVVGRGNSLGVAYTQAKGEESIFDSQLGKVMEEKMRGVWRSWKRVRIHEMGGLEALQKEQLVYLTADTEETITELEDGKTYVIGGIVDKNRYKNLCLMKAQRLGIKVAKLPISQENLDELEDRLRKEGQTAGAFQGRKVLTVNQVVDILIGWNETGDWVEAIRRGLPRRKFNANDKGKVVMEKDEETEDQAEDEDAQELEQTGGDL